MNSLGRHAVLIEPDGSLREAVRAWKARVAARWPSAVYLADPPHSTLWVGEVRDLEDAEREVRDTAARILEFSITIRGPHVFYDDALAGGGQTCAFAAVLTGELARLQSSVADGLRRHRSPASDDQLPAPMRREPFLGSWREYGFPFVGSHWIPHFTIASLPVRRDDPFIAEWFGATASWQVPVRHLSWWRVVGGRHERLASLRLAPAVS